MKFRKYLPYCKGHSQSFPLRQFQVTFFFAIICRSNCILTGLRCRSAKHQRAGMENQDDWKRRWKDRLRTNQREQSKQKQVLRKCLQRLPVQGIVGVRSTLSASRSSQKAASLCFLGAIFRHIEQAGCSGGPGGGLEDIGRQSCTVGRKVSASQPTTLKYNRIIHVFQCLDLQFMLFSSIMTQLGTCMNLKACVQHNCDL